MKNSTKLLLIVMLVGISTSIKAQTQQRWRGQNGDYGYGDYRPSQNGNHGNGNYRPSQNGNHGYGYYGSFQNGNHGYGDYRPSQNGSHGIQRGFRGYRGFDWVNSRRVNDGYRSFMIVTLRNRNLFVELTLNRHGRIIEKNEYRVRRRHRYGSYHSGGYVYNHQDHYLDSRDIRNWRDYQWEAEPTNFGKDSEKISASRW